MTWVYPVLGMMEEVPSAIKDAQARPEDPKDGDVKKALKEMEEQLAKSEFLIGSSVTLADIVCALKEGFKRVFDPNFRKPFPKTCQWFEKCCKMPQFKSILGDVKLCATPEKPRALLPAFVPNPREKAGCPWVNARIFAGRCNVTKEKSPKPEPKAAPKAEAKAAPAPAMANGGDLDAQIAALGDQIRAKKEELKAGGLSGKKCGAHPEVKEMVDKLLELKNSKSQGPPAEPKAAPKAEAKAAPAPAMANGGDLDSQIAALGNQIRAKKEELKAGGLSGKKCDAHPEA
eukprot:Skav225133  [mRNA]  locus=scaffold1056:65781:68980:+ [translate_table: standard]